MSTRCQHQGVDTHRERKTSEEKEQIKFLLLKQFSSNYNDLSLSHYSFFRRYYNLNQKPYKMIPSPTLMASTSCTSASESLDESLSELLAPSEVSMSTKASPVCAISSI